MKKYSLAVIGATGLVGRNCIKILEDENLNISEYYFFASNKSKGKKILFKNIEYEIKELDETTFKNNAIDYALFCVNSETALKYIPLAVQNNCIVIDNSSAYRMENNVPLVIPEINIKDLEYHNGIIANPNCSTIQALVALKPLHDNYKIKRLVISTYQAVSGAGYLGCEDLKNGYLGLENKKFPHQIYNNCIPHIDTFLNNDYTKEEMKIINETHKIFHDDKIQITATAVRVPVFNCHSESINIEFEKEYDICELKNILKHSPGIKVIDDTSKNMYPLASKCSGKNDVFIGRIRRDYSIHSGLNLWVVADNIRKGASLNAVQILKILLNYHKDFKLFT